MSIIGEIAYKLTPVGSFLADLEKRTKNATDHAAERGDVFLANAGDKVYRAIKNAQTAYYESLDKTIDKIDNEGQKFFESIDLAVRNVETSAERTSKELRDSLHSIMDRIPFLKTQPQLMEIEGAVITRSSYTNSFPVTLQGYFPEIGQQWPTLEINGVVLHPNDVTYFNLARNLARNVFSILGWTAVGVGGVGMVNRSWKFYDYFTFSKVYGREDESSEGEYFTMILAAGAACLVFSHLCFGNNAGNADHATLRKITFDVPFDKLGPYKGTVDLVKGVVKFPRKSWIFNYSDDFPIRITVLPNSPGTILLRSTYPKIQNFEKDRETFISEVELHSSKTDRKGDQESRIFIQAPPW